MAKAKVADYPELVWLDDMADLLDNRFRIPFTQFRFGVDAILGLFPYVGDVFTFTISAFLIFVMGRRGASGMLAVKMIGNILVDMAVGIVPFIGDIADFRIRANRKNVDLMLEHYQEGRHRGSAWPVVFAMLFLLVGLTAASIYTVGWLWRWMMRLFQGAL